MTDMNQIHDRIQKLLAMAKDTSSPNEAMIAMERARRLMNKYQIEESDLMTADEHNLVAVTLFGKQYKFMPVWLNILATAVCQLNGVRGGIVYGDIAVAGFEEDVALTKMMFDRLVEECTIQCKVDQMARGFGSHYNAKAGDAFKKGFATAVSVRVKEILAQQLQEEADTTALIIRKMDIVEQKFGKMETKEKATKTRSDARDAFRRGVEKGNQAKIQTEVGA